MSDHTPARPSAKTRRTDTTNPASTKQRRTEELTTDAPTPAGTTRTDTTNTPAGTKRPAPSAIADLVAFADMGADPDEPCVRAALAAMPDFPLVCAAVPRTADAGAKRDLVIALRDQKAAIPKAALPRLGALLADIARTLFAPPDAHQSLSQIAPVARPYLQAMRTLRIPPELLAAVDDRRAPPGLNPALDATRLTALALVPQEAYPVLLHGATAPTTELAAAGIRFALAGVLAPMLAAALSAATRGATRVSVPTAHAILFGDEDLLRSLEPQH